jgi:hypothetical protein
MPFIPNTGAISFDNQIEYVFEDQTTPAMSLSEYYRNGTNVQTAITATNVITSSVVTSGIPTSGQISFSDFRNQGFNTVAVSAIFDRSNVTLGSQISFTVPANVYQVSAVCVGAGGGGGGNSSTSFTGASAGGGGGLVYGNISVSPGQTLDIVVGAGGAGGTNGGTNGSDGGDTYIYKSGSPRLIGYGGKGGESDVNNNTPGGAGGLSGGFDKTAGGTGGRGGASSSAIPHKSPGGGGAGGYGSSGGNGWHADGSPQAANGGAGGGAGGSRTQSSSSNNGFPEDFQAGGATGIYGWGDNGLRAVNAPLGVHQQGSRHGSNYFSASSGYTGPLGPASGLGSITPPTSGSANHQSFTGKAASPGGGGAGIIQSKIGYGMAGGDGAVRIVWGNQSNGNTRQYPNFDDVSGD